MFTICLSWFNLKTKAGRLEFCVGKVLHVCVGFRLSEFFSEFEMFLGNETEVGTVVQILEDLQTLQQIQQQALNGTLDCMYD